MGELLGYGYFVVKIAIFGRFQPKNGRMAKRPKEKLCPTTLPPNGRKDTERETFYIFRGTTLVP